MARWFLLLVLVSVLSAPATAETGVLSKGTTGVHYFELGDADERAELTITWLDRAAEFELILLSPSGTTLGGSVKGLKLESKPLALRAVLDRRLDEELGWQGLWLARLRCLKAHPKRLDVPYVFTVDTGPDMTIQVRGLGGIHRAGDQVSLTIEARPDAAGAELESVRADVLFLGEGQPFEVMVRDDGKVPDERADDGVYVGGFSWPGPGRYVVVVSAKGRTPDGKVLQRDRLEEVDVRGSR